MQSFRISYLLALLLTAVLAAPGVHAASNCPTVNSLTTPTTDFTINGNGTVSHLKTGLMWKQCVEGLSGANCDVGVVAGQTWDNALIAAAAPFAGYSDWRLPNQKELGSIVETGCTAPSINEVTFPNTPTPRFFWSSTTNANDTTSAWVVYFADGYSRTDPKSNALHVRLVRGGQPFDSFDAKKKGQVIVFGAAPTVVVSGSGTVSATGGGSLNPVTFSNLGSAVCTVSGSTATGVSAGNCVVAANQAGDAFYNAAQQVTQNIAIGKANQSIGFGAAPTIVVDGTGTASAFATSGLAVSKSSITPGVCTISGSTVTGVAASTCTLTGDQHGNTNYYGAPQATQSFPIGKGSQAITFGLAPTLAVGGSGVVNAAGGASGNAVTFSSTTLGVCTISGGHTANGLAAGTCIIAANQLGNANYYAAAQATQTFSIGKGSQVIIFGPAPTVAAGYTGVVSATGGASGVPVTFSSTTASVCLVSGSTVTGLATSGTCTIAADQAGNADYYPAPQVLQTLVLLDTTIRLNDTGQDKCYDGSALVACSAANSGNAATHPGQDGRFGRDAAAAAGQLTKIGGGDKGFDYTRVCMSGELAGQGACPTNPVQGTGANQWACTKDNVTHRLWSLENGYGKWATYAIGTYPAAVNASSRCGYTTGWRLPTRRELFSTVHKGRINPAIDSAYFPGTVTTQYYWSADSYVSTYYFMQNYAWAANFWDGDAYADPKTLNRFVRLVRSVP